MSLSRQFRIGLLQKLYGAKSITLTAILWRLQTIEGKTPRDDVVKFPLNVTAPELIETLMEGIEQTIEDYTRA